MRSAVTRRSTRSRDSASAGNASSASKAAVSRAAVALVVAALRAGGVGRPLGRRSDGRDGRSGGRGHDIGGRGRIWAVASGIGIGGRTIERPDARRRPPSSVASAASMRRSALVAPEHRERLEDPGETVVPGDAPRAAAGRRRAACAARLDHARAAPARSPGGRTARHRASASRAPRAVTRALARRATSRAPPGRRRARRR